MVRIKVIRCRRTEEIKLLDFASMAKRGKALASVWQAKSIRYIGTCTYFGLLDQSFHILGMIAFYQELSVK